MEGSDGSRSTRKKKMRPRRNALSDGERSRYRDNRRERGIGPTNSVGPLTKESTDVLRHGVDEDGTFEEKKFKLRERRSIADGVDPIGNGDFADVEEDENRSRGTIEAEGSDERKENIRMKLKRREDAAGEIITMTSIVTTNVNEETISDDTRK